MTFDIELIKSFYSSLSERINFAKAYLDRPLTFTEKILYTHLFDTASKEVFTRGESHVDFAPDRVSMQDATAQMALLQFMLAGKDRVHVPTTVHCDHLIQAQVGAREDLAQALDSNKEIYNFLSSVCNKYGIGFWEPGAGIIHQVVLENYAFPGGMMIGTDSHTPNGGGLGMVAIGVGGADAVDVMTGMPWELKMPKIIGIRLTGRLSGWTSSKDVILKVAGILTVKGGTDAIIEYFGDGAESISCTGKGTICNMGAEIGATTSVFPYDDKMADYLNATARSDIADLANGVKEHLKPDQEIYDDPEKYFDQLIEIDLSTLEPHINGPYTPDLAWPLSKFADAVRENKWPEKLEVALLGSCTNSSYEDLTRATSIVDQAISNGLNVVSEFTITPGSEQVRYTAERDGIIQKFEKIGGLVLANACGPCIGQWKRHNAEPDKKNSILTSYNRNFAKRNDGNPNTHSFVTSPELVTAFALAGTLTFNPMTDPLKNEAGEEFMLDEPVGIELPSKGFDVKELGFTPPSDDKKDIDIIIDPDSNRIQALVPFNKWDGIDLKELKLLIKVKGKCTTDHISMAGPWLRFRGHLDNISDNLLIGATNSFYEAPGMTKDASNGGYKLVPEVARAFKANGQGLIIVGEDNYGEGSSREHAAMEPRFLGVKAVLVKSFARIHETNLKKQGVLALTFSDLADYDKIMEDDTIDITGLQEMIPKSQLTMLLNHNDGTSDEIIVNQSYSDNQLKWFRAGSALNLIREQQ